MNNTEIVEAFLSAAEICLRNALQMGATYSEVEQMVHEAIKEARQESVYCDIHG